jgi:hypothetical protein
MNRKKLTIIAMGMLILITVAGARITEAPAAGKAEQHVIVVVKKMPDGLSVDPVTTKSGEPVIWVNYGPGPMKIKILTTVGFACANPVNFYADPWGNYESSQIPEHSIASICIIAKGEYKYEARRFVKFGDKFDEEIIPSKIIVK